jgi:D-alanyl-D-alanine carboxypeptidase
MNYKSILRYICFSLVLVICHGYADVDMDQIDGLFTEAYPANEPGVTVIAVKNGEVVFRGAYGMADLEHEIPLKTDMVFRLGSITKQFTAVAIMMLEQEGSLSVSDDITQYLPKYPTNGKTITIEHLLTHTSGIPNYTDIPGWMASKIRNSASVDEMMDGWKDLPLEFEPGETFTYSNSGYFMLGAIIEAASGVDYETFIESRIFKPLGMKNSYYDRSDRIIPGRVQGYAQVEDGFINAPFLDMSQPYAAGSLASSVEDLALWDASLYTEKLLPREARQRMWTPFRFNNGELSSYAYGWGIGEHNGSPLVQHNGGIFGFSTAGIRMPDQQLYVSVLSNGAGTGPGGMAQKVTMALLGEELELVGKDVPVTEFDGLQGVYRIDDSSIRVVTVEDGKVYSQRTDGQRFEVIPLGNDRFFYANSLTQVQFHRENSNVTHMEVHSFGNVPARAERSDEPIPEATQVADIDTAIYSDYAGDYELMPGFVLTVWPEEGRLMVQATGQSSIEMSPKSESVFFNTNLGAEMTFHCDVDGMVSKMVLVQGGQTLEGAKQSP